MRELYDADVWWIKKTLRKVAVGAAAAAAVLGLVMIAATDIPIALTPLPILALAVATYNVLKSHDTAVILVPQ
jgi:hypothetical protein